MQQLNRPFHLCMLLFLFAYGMCMCTCAGRSQWHASGGHFRNYFFPSTTRLIRLFSKGPYLLSHLSGPSPFHMDIFFNDNCWGREHKTTSSLQASQGCTESSGVTNRDHTFLLRLSNSMLRWAPGLARLLLLWKPMLWQLTLPITAGSCSNTPHKQYFSCWQPREPDFTPSLRAALAALPVLLLYQLTVCSVADEPHRRLSAHAHRPRDWACLGYTVTWERWKQRQQA